MSKETARRSKAERKEDKTGSNNANMDNNLNMEDKTQEYQEQYAAMVKSTPELPDLVICQILQLLSTRYAIRASILSKQWERVWSLIPLLDFDEEEQHGDHVFQHDKFEYFVTNCLRRHEKDHKQEYLDKFRLRTRYYGYENLINQCLSFAIWKNVKQLDLSLYTTHNLSYPLYNLPHTVLNAKSLTSLNLESVAISWGWGFQHVRLPSLKSMSLKEVLVDEFAFVKLILGCPSIENLSIDSCGGLSRVDVSSSSLKSLEVIRGFTEYELTVKAANLESFRLGDSVHHVSGNDDFNERRGTIIETPKLRSCEFIGYWQTGFSLNAPKLSEATIILGDRADSYFNTFPHNPKMRNFLGQFDCSGKMSLHVMDAETIIVPKELRRSSTTLFPPLPSLKNLQVIITSPTLVSESSLRNSLRRMAPALDREGLSIQKKSCWRLHVKELIDLCDGNFVD
ncbi:hypothetical protein ACFX2B_004780 [Malus domestica]